MVATLFGEEVQTKVCIKCGEEKPLCEFSPRTRDRNGNPVELRNDCKSCQKKAGNEVKRLKKLHPKPDFDTYQCPCCKRTKADLAYTAWKNPFVLDHDHSTGEARGWICQDCNTALARIKDNITTARNLVTYLENKDRGLYLVEPSTLDGM